MEHEKLNIKTPKEPVLKVPHPEFLCLWITALTFTGQHYFSACWSTSSKVSLKEKYNCNMGSKIYEEFWTQSFFWLHLGQHFQFLLLLFQVVVSQGTQMYQAVTSFDRFCDAKIWYGSSPGDPLISGNRGWRMVFIMEIS